METNYLILLDYSVGEVIKIRLGEEEKAESEEYEDFEDAHWKRSTVSGFPIALGCVVGF